MPLRRLTYSTLLALVLASPAGASDLVPFEGHWSGSTQSVTPVGPGVVLVVSSGTGTATQVGAFQMVSPHLTYLDTFEVVGTQHFVAASGDTVNGTISGRFVPMPDGTLAATLVGVITGGTGRFTGASGAYAFEIVARPAGIGFDSTATIKGLISSVGAN